jgi:hypothetical protein
MFFCASFQVASASGGWKNLKSVIFACHLPLALVTQPAVPRLASSCKLKNRSILVKVNERSMSGPVLSEPLAAPLRRLVY